MKYFWLILYYGFAKHLPKSNTPIIGEFALRLRYVCARHMFSRCDGFVNLEQGAHVGSGKNFYVGKNVGIGKDFICHSRVVTIYDGLLMGENVLFQGGGTYSQILTCR